MVKDHLFSEREKNPLPPLNLVLFPISSKRYFYMHHPRDRIVHTTKFVTPVQAGTINIHEGSIRRPITP